MCARVARDLPRARHKRSVMALGRVAQGRLVTLVADRTQRLAGSELAGDVVGRMAGDGRGRSLGALVSALAWYGIARLLTTIVASGALDWRDRVIWRGSRRAVVARPARLLIRRGLR